MWIDEKGGCVMQRWAPTWLWDDIDDERRMPRAIMEAVDDGNWVKHSDAAALIAAKDAEIEGLTRENADLRAKLADSNHRAQSQADAVAIACRGTPHRSAADLRQALDEQAEAVRVLAADIARTQKYVLKLRNGYDDLKRSIGKVSCAHPSDALTQLIQSWDDFANNPIAAAAVKEAGDASE